MAPSLLPTSSSNPNPKIVTHPITQALSYIRSKNDTNRFAGLTLLQKTLDNSASLRQDIETLQQCWTAIPNTFLTRLLKSRASEKCRADAAQLMVSLAVSIILTFVKLLGNGLGTQRCVALVPGLVGALSMEGLDEETRRSIWGVLWSLAGESEIAVMMCEEKLMDGLNADAARRSTGADDLSRLLIIMQSASPLASSSEAWDAAIQHLVQSSQQDKPRFVLEIMAAVLDGRILPFQADPPWLSSLLRLAQGAMVKTPTAAVRRAVIAIYAAIIRSSHDSTRTTGALFDSPADVDPSKPPFTYVFINLLLVDIRSTIPSLMERLASPDYTTTALRLASCFDVITAFTSWLLNAMSESDADISETQSETKLVMSADHLLKLQRDIKETFSLTLEYLRDRWDGAVAGAKGLDPATYDIVRPVEVADEPLALTWDNPLISPKEDPLVLSSLRSIALWVKEDEDSELHEQVLSIFDVLVVLLKSDSDARSNEQTAAVDFRSVTLLMLSALLPAHEGAVQQFLELNVWSIVSELALAGLKAKGEMPFTRDAVQCLVSVVDSPLVPQARQAWMATVTQISVIKLDASNKAATSDLVAGYQLCAALMSKAAVRIRKMFSSERATIIKKAEKLMAAAHVDEETKLELDEALPSLVDLDL